MGLWDERFSRCYSIVWPRELVLGLLEALTASKHGCTIPTLFYVGNCGLVPQKVLVTLRGGGSTVSEGYDIRSIEVPTHDITFQKVRSRQLRQGIAKV